MLLMLRDNMYILKSSLVSVLVSVIQVQMNSLYVYNILYFCISLAKVTGF